MTYPDTKALRASGLPMKERFAEFLTERKYLKNVSVKTLVYYGCAFDFFGIENFRNPELVYFG